MADVILAGDGGIFKFCSHCSKTLHLHEFRRDTRRLTGRDSICTQCNRRLSNAYRAKNLEEVKRKVREKRAADPEHAHAIEVARYARDAEKRKKEASEYYWKNRERVLARLSGPEGRRQARERMRAKMQNPQDRLHHNISRAIRSSIKDKRQRSWEELVGYSLADLMTHIERQFTRGMTWANHGKGDGKWHVDHILPMKMFSFESADDPDFKTCWALTNLRPMWGKDNISKHAKRLYLL